MIGIGPFVQVDIHVGNADRGVVTLEEDVFQETSALVEIVAAAAQLLCLRRKVGKQFRLQV